MFPLGSVLLPHMPLPLRVFEPRYLQLLADILPSEPAEFGVALIERGFEVGGGDARFPIGTIAQVAEVGSDEGSVVLLARGARRIRIVRWLDEDPYPRAETDDVTELEWDESLGDRLAEVDAEVRRALALASEYLELPWSADIELNADPVQHAWQLAGIAPLGPLDQLSLLASQSVAELLESTSRCTAEALETLRYRVEGADGDLPGA
ncbi:MAG: LON peptidase substrate-binding domain-containing protein [Micrococcales bacterium]|nr:LON peptidase substrate-binding domain-containing protein [Micrococcales bacterium]